jgi:hypothetical protein
MKYDSMTGAMLSLAAAVITRAILPVNTQPGFVPDQEVRAQAHERYGVFRRRRG